MFRVFCYFHIFSFPCTYFVHILVIIHLMKEKINCFYIKRSYISYSSPFTLKKFHSNYKPIYPNIFIRTYKKSSLMLAPRRKNRYCLLSLYNYVLLLDGYIICLLFNCKDYLCIICSIKMEYCCIFSSLSEVISLY